MKISKYDNNNYNIKEIKGNNLSFNRVIKEKNKKNYIKNDETPKQSINLKNNSIFDDFSDESISNRFRNKSNSNRFNKKNCSKTPVNMLKRKILLEDTNRYIIGKNKSFIQSLENINNKGNCSMIKDKNLVINQNQHNNYKENIRNLFTKRTLQKMSICSPGYFSKHSLQINSINKFSNILLKRNNNPFSKTPNWSINYYS